MDNLVILPIAVVVIAGLVFWFRRSQEQNRFEAVMKRAAAKAGMCSRAELIDGANHIPVALSLDANQINYESADLDGSIDIGRIDEVEYESGLVSGGHLAGSVLRLRSHGRMFEFVLDPAAATLWSQHLPAHKMNEAGTVRSI